MGEINVGKSPINEENNPLYVNLNTEEYSNSNGNTYGTINGNENGGIQGQQENADSLVGVIQPQGYVGGFIGVNNNSENVQNSSGTYVGGYIDSSTYTTPSLDNSIEEASSTNLPAKRGFWSIVKSVLFEKEIEFCITEKEHTVLMEIHDFLFQDISIKGFFDILKIGKNKNK